MYKYFENDIFEKKINYSYSLFMGMDFISEWFNYRLKFLNNESKILLSRKEIEYFFSSKNKILLEIYFDLKKEVIIEKRLLLLLKRFEVEKKIYTTYDHNCKPIDKESYRQIDNYLKFGYLLVIAYQKTVKLQYLNALIKLCDILCSYYNNHDKSNKFFNVVLSNEYEFVKTLFEKKTILRFQVMAKEQK